MRLRVIVAVIAALAVVAAVAFPVHLDRAGDRPRLVIGNMVAAQVADYTCDGVNDDVQFQEAIDALPAGGGMIYVLAGNYSFSGTVTRSIDNISIVGLGGATSFVCDNSTPLFEAGGDRWLFANLRTDGGGLAMGVTDDWCWLNVGVAGTLYSVLTSEGGVLGMEIHGNEWHSVAFATSASVTAINATLNDAVDNIAVLESGLSALNVTCIDLAADIADLNATLSALNGTVVGIQADIVEIDNSLVALNSSVVGLVSSFGVLNSTVYALNSSVVALNITVDNLTTSVASINATVQANRICAIVYVIDGGGAAIAAGAKGFLTIPFACMVNNWTVVSDVAGAIQVDIWQDTYGNFPPTDADSMCSGKEVKITATNQKGQDTDITDWTTTTISAGSILGFYVDSCSTITRVTVTITATRTL